MHSFSMIGMHGPRVFSTALSRLRLCVLVAIGLAAPLAAQSAGTSIPGNTWVTVPTNGFPVQVVGYGKLVYASGIKKAVMLENYHQLGSEPNEAYVAYDFATNRWDVLNLNGNFHTESMPDAGHAVGMFSYNPNQNVFVHYCCFSGSMGTEQPLHTWWFDPVGQVARDKHTSAKPGLTMQATATFDSAHNTYVFWDGSSGTWTYNPTTNVWTQQTPTGTLPPATMSNFPAMAYNTADQKVYMFGGGTNNIFTYDVPTNQWTKLTPTGTAPSARNSAPFAYDSRNHIFLIFGGATASGTALNDTWVYDPVANSWTKLSPATSPSVISAFPSWQYLTYDPDDNVFMMVTPGNGVYTGGTWTSYATQTWFFRYSGTGPNVGTSVSNPTPTAGSINRNADAWANEPALASTGTSLYLSWIETGRPFDSTDGTWPHVYVSQLIGSTWTPLGNSFLSLDSEFTGYNESHSPALMVVGGQPWVSWYRVNNSGSLPPNNLYAKTWNGTSWSGGTVDQGNPASAYSAQGRSQMTVAGGALHIAFLDTERNTYPWNTLLYVKSWNGSNWVLKGTGPLNNTPTVNGNVADSVAITSDGTNPIVAWTEYTSSNFIADSNPQVYVARWNGTSWVSLGGALNVNPSNRAYDVTLAYLGGQPYAAWTERSDAGSAQLFVKTWNGTKWTQVGSGALNKDAVTGWAFRPTLMAAASSNSLYLGWVEQQNIGQQPQAYVMKYQGGAWTPLGGSLNASPFSSAERVSLAVLNGQPVAAWGEVKPGTLRQIFVKQWNGTAWASVTGSGNADTTPPTTPTNLVASAIGASQVNLTWTASTDNVGVAGYQIYRAGVEIGTSPTNSYSDTTVAPSTTYTYTVSAFDAAGNVSPQSAPAAIRTGAATLNAPTNLTATAASSTQIGLSWTAAAGATGYRVYRGGSQIGTTAVTNFSDTGLTPSTTYSYTVASTNSAGAVSAQTAPVSATTLASGGGGGGGTGWIGPGHTTATCIDKDGDGYGIGPGCLGADADDTDPTVNTPASWVSKYSSIDGLLQRRGYTAARRWYVAKTGNDTACGPNLISQPCATFAHVHPLLQAGDIVLWRAGTYKEAIYNLYPAISGTPTSPLIFMAYPGERVVIDDPNSVELCNDPNTVHDVILDGFVLDNSDPQHLGQAVDGCLLTNVTLRNMEAKNHSRGFFVMQDTHNLLIENNVVHDCPDSHGMYLGARDLPNSNITVRNNIIYSAGLTGFQHNGRVTNLIVDGNIIYGFMSAAGISLEMGVSHSFIRNNVVFAGDRSPLVIYDYDSPIHIDPTIAPYDENYNLIENNTFAVGTVFFESGNPLPSQFPNIAIYLATVNQFQDLGHNTFRNNILWNPASTTQISVQTSSSYYSCAVAGTCAPNEFSMNGSDPSSILSTLTFENNIVYPAASPAVVSGTNVSTLVFNGTRPTPPPPITLNYSWPQFTSMPLVKGNIQRDPLFIHNNPTEAFGSTSLFNLGLQSGSPAAAAGLTTGAPPTDVQARTRPNPPSIGAYELAETQQRLPCDINGDGVVDVRDVQSAINQALGVAPCTTADLQQNGHCDVVDVQRVIVAVFGGVCTVGP